jgi:3-deoxy-D-arabino-heptulosonate 7-phosphate (DAHP) synthase
VAVQVLQKVTCLPLIVDPNIAAGACGLIVEVQYNPAEALVDAQSNN